MSPRYRRDMAARIPISPAIAEQATPSQLSDSSAVASLRISAATALSIPFVLLLLAKASHPVGYMGGGADDWQYLAAARCVAEHGLCVPHSHWAARFPLVAPMGWAIALLGEARWTVQLVPFAYAIGCAMLLTANVACRFGRAAGVVAGSVFALTPVVLIPAMQPAIDLPELCWVLAAALAAQHGVARDDRRLALVAGACFALAFASRPTALAFALSALVLVPLLPRSAWRLALPAALGFVAVIGGEWAGYALATGNPLHGIELSLHHTRIPSSELRDGVDLSASPLLNPDFIRNWRRSMGIEVFWPADPFLNLVADPMIGFTLLAAAVMAVLNRRALDRDLRMLAAMAMVHMLVLVFVMAIDPKPRMFTAEAAVAATLFGVLAARWRATELTPVVPILALLILVRGLVSNYDTPSFVPAARVASAWAQETRTPLAIEPIAAQVMPFDHALRILPQQTPGEVRRAVLALADTRCAERRADYPADRWRIAREHRLLRTEPAAIGWLRRHNILFGATANLAVCRFDPIG